MTEVVTNTAASLQQTLVADHQQRAFRASAASAEASSTQISVAVKPTGEASADAVARAPKSDQSQTDSRRNDQPSPEQKIKRNVPDPADAPSVSKTEGRAEAVKVELKDFDVGRRPAEVVGLPDVVQRFDNDLDGRVGLLESQRAAKARDSGFTYAARGQARSDTAAIAEQVQERAVERSVETSGAVLSQQNAQPVRADQPGQSAENGEPAKKIFEGPQVVSGGTSEDGTVPEKIFGSEAAAEQGSFSDGEPVPQKLYGDGAEVVIGRFAADLDGQQKLSEKADQVEPGRFYEEGSGEQKLYDKVAQTEAGRFFEDPSEQKLYGDQEQPQADQSADAEPTEQSLYEKAQQVEAQTAVASSEDLQPKKLYGELDLYADVAELGEEIVEVPVTGVAPVTA